MYKMSYYHFNRQEIFQKATYYKVLFTKQRSNQYKNLSEEEKYKTKEYQRKRHHQLIQYKKKHYKINEFCFCSVEE